jgi:molecular chaperone DnaK (HSP70)
VARLGIDFGTTHTVTSLVDRGSYPVVSFEGGDFVPSVVAADAEGRLRFGEDAEAMAHRAGWTALRSFKRLLEGAGPDTEVSLGARSFRLLDLLTLYFAHVRTELLRRSNAGIAEGERLEVAVSVPAHATSGQRFLTLDAFGRAGFDVQAVLNEPSAAAFEYAHRHGRTITSRREHVLIYDMGGGTFDASLIHMTGRRNEVLASAGVSRLGGDDFDEAILDLVIEAAGAASPAVRDRSELLDDVRRQKEAVGPNTRRFVLDLEALSLGPVAVPIEEVYGRCEPLVRRSIETTQAALSESAVTEEDLAGVYVVGGASSFPVVYRLLRERFGQHRVHRATQPFAATALGLAIYLGGEAGYELSDRLTRYFGVWREADAGRDVSFDVLFEKDAPLPAPGEAPAEVVRRYRAAHDIGHFRFVECARLSAGHPDGDMVRWQEIRFPFDPALRDRALVDAPVRRLARAGPLIEERYRWPSTGVIEVTISCLEDGYGETFTIAPAS